MSDPDVASHMISGETGVCYALLIRTITAARRRGKTKLRIPQCSVRERRSRNVATTVTTGVLERAMGIEPTTYSLGSCRSTTELRPQTQ